MGRTEIKAMVETYIEHRQNQMPCVVDGPGTIMLKYEGDKVYGKCMLAANTHGGILTSRRYNLVESGCPKPEKENLIFGPNSKHCSYMNGGWNRVFA